MTQATNSNASENNGKLVNSVQILHLSQIIVANSKIAINNIVSYVTDGKSHLFIGIGAGVAGVILMISIVIFISIKVKKDKASSKNIEIGRI